MRENDTKISKRWTVSGERMIECDWEDLAWIKQVRQNDAVVLISASEARASEFEKGQRTDEPKFFSAWLLISNMSHYDCSKKGSPLGHSSSPPGAFSGGWIKPITAQTVASSPFLVPQREQEKVPVDGMSRLTLSKRLRELRKNIGSQTTTPFVCSDYRRIVFSNDDNKENVDPSLLLAADHDIPELLERADEPDADCLRKGGREEHPVFHGMPCNLTRQELTVLCRPKRVHRPRPRRLSSRTNSPLPGLEEPRSTYSEDGASSVSSYSTLPSSISSPDLSRRGYARPSFANKPETAMPSIWLSTPNIGRYGSS
ncbi:hypothetical protein EDD86DRAFT_269450 [Gorgonomyces haynaldii]|nr:hypothetical protein EDD86DRAFT_269450 [Gorgonomyces haynaldii]